MRVFELILKGKEMRASYAFFPVFSFIICFAVSLTVFQMTTGPNGSEKKNAVESVAVSTGPDGPPNFNSGG